MNAVTRDIKIDAAVIQDAIAQLEMRANEIRNLVYANPASEIVQLRAEVNHELSKNGYTAAREFIKSAIKRERKLLWQLRVQKRNAPMLILELIDLDMQIDAMHKELSALNYPLIVSR